MAWYRCQATLQIPPEFALDYKKMMDQIWATSRSAETFLPSPQNREVDCRTGHTPGRFKRNPWQETMWRLCFSKILSLLLLDQWSYPALRRAFAFCGHSRPLYLARDTVASVLCLENLICHCSMYISRHVKVNSVGSIAHRYCQMSPASPVGRSL